MALWVAQCKWGSAGLSAGVAKLPPAKRRMCHQYLPLEFLPGAEVRKEKSSGGQNRRGNSGREMESFQKSARGHEHPGCPLGTISSLRAVGGVTPSPFF